MSDGRFKCKQCKKKFSARSNRARISSATLSSLAEHFWNMDTAEQCANSLGINRKTAQSYYDRLRGNIARSNATALKQITHRSPLRSRRRGNGKLPVFWSLLQQNQIRIVFPEAQSFSLEKQDLPDVQGVSEIYTNSPAALKNRVLDKFYRRTLWARKETDEKLLQQFWRLAKINLARYRGGCKNKFPLFIEEMAFRFNHRESEGAIPLLQESLGESATTNSTEENGR